MKRFALWIGIALVPTAGFAASGGADTLLNTLGKPTTSQAPQVGVSIATSQLKDPFTIQFFSQYQVQQDLPYDVRAWVTRILNGDYQHAAHLWSAMQKQVPESFRVPAEGAYLYLLWKVGLGQTFFDEWTDRLTQKSFVDSPVAFALDQTIAGEFNAWLVDQGIQVSETQKALIEKLDVRRGGHVATLKAYVALRSGASGLKTLELLPLDHPLKATLAQSVALGLARVGDLAGAGAVLKNHVEPAIELLKDSRALARHYLEVARMLYQAGALDAAADFYQRIPNGADDYLKAREELAWVWLRMGQTGKLRGELQSLRVGLFEDRFAPDVYVVRSISNLKLCYFAEAEKDLKAFVTTNKVWAQKVTEALKSEEPPAIEESDFFVKMAGRSLARRTRERDVLDTLATQSITAVLPAVGPQQHWEKAKGRAIAALERAKKQVATENRRQWKNRSRVLAEAIRKMQFVKVELYSQVRTLAQESGANSNDQSKGLEKDTEARLNSDTQAMLKQASAGELVFPFDGVMWPDELFHLTSVAQSKCQAKADPAVRR
jgi:tetratricopeptide (TPR) repeat protein